jgi:hypothetical protein
MSEKNGHWIGLIAAFLSLSSMPLLGLSSMCMSEVPGLLMSFLTFLLYLKAERQRKTYLFFLAGICMALTLFTKWHHGVFVIPAIFFTRLTYKGKIFSRHNYYLFVPFFVLIIAWFIHPQHVLSFYGHSTFQPHYYEFFSLENWLYYPSSFLQIYHSTPIFAIIIGISFLYSLKQIKDPKIRLFLIHILVGIILLTIKLDNRHRYIITIVPSVWILGATQLVETVKNINDHLNSRKFKIALFSIFILGFLLISFLSIPRVYRTYPDSLLKTQYWCDEKPNKAYDFISKNVAGHRQIAVFGSWDYYNSLKSSTIMWHIEVNRQNDLVDGQKGNKKSYYYLSQLLRKRDPESYQNLIHFLENKNVKVHEYHLLSFMKALDEKHYLAFRKNINLNPFSDKITNVTRIDNDINFLITIYKKDENELNRFADSFLSKQKEWTQLNRKHFDSLSITINLYERKKVKMTI